MTAEQVTDAAAYLDSEVKDGPRPASNAVPAAAPAKPHPVRVLSRYFGTVCDLVHDNGRAYAVPRVSDGECKLEDHPRGVAIPFGAEFRRLIVREANRTALPPVTGSIADTVQLHLEAKAFGNDATELALRFHDNGERIVLDLGRKDGQAVIITADGWTVGAIPTGVVFRRSHAIRPLPVPVGGGTLDELAPLLALAPDSEQFRALLGWTAGLAFADEQRPGILHIGPPGSGKSTRLRLAISIVEPTSDEDFGKHFGRSPDDDEVRALHRAVPVWDNVSAMSQLASDHLCVLITGTAREGRQLYTNDEISTASVKRPVALTAVGTPAGLRPDALDRLIIAEHETPAARLPDGEVQRQFDSAHPRLLGAWCNAVAMVLRWRPYVTITGNPRMAAHVQTLTALDAAVKAGELKGCPAGLLDAYTEAHLRVQQQTAADDTFGGALIAFLEGIPLTVRNPAGDKPAYIPVTDQGGIDPGRRWKGKAAELLTGYGLHRPLNAPGWPTSPRGLPVVLNQLKEPLAAVGVTWTAEQDPHTKSSQYSFTLRDI